MGSEGKRDRPLVGSGKTVGPSGAAVAAATLRFVLGDADSGPPKNHPRGEATSAGSRRPEQKI